MRSGGEALGVVAIADDAPPVRNEQRPRLQEIARRLGLEPVAAGDRRLAVEEVQARAGAVPRGRERLGRPRRPVDADLAERGAVRPDEEPADDGVGHPGLAPARQRRRPVERDDAGAERDAVVARAVQGGGGPAGERRPHAPQPGGRDERGRRLRDMGRGARRHRRAP